MNILLDTEIISFETCYVMAICLLLKKDSIQLYS